PPAARCVCRQPAFRYPRTLRGPDGGPSARCPGSSARRTYQRLRPVPYGQTFGEARSGGGEVCPPAAPLSRPAASAEDNPAGHARLPLRLKTVSPSLIVSSTAISRTRIGSTASGLAESTTRSAIFPTSIDPFRASSN